MKQYIAPFIGAIFLVFNQSILGLVVFAVTLLFSWYVSRSLLDSRVLDAAGLLNSKDSDVKSFDTHLDKYKSNFGTQSRVLGATEHKELQPQREKHYAEMVNQYYDLATDFYEYGWGQSFHFAPRFPEESLQESIRRHEYWLALRVALQPGFKCLDLGCGVGGPARNIARFSGAKVTGLNNNDYQIKLANQHTERMRMKGQVDFVKGDFMKLPFEAETFDAAYQIESACHAPKLVDLFRGVHRVLKPGGLYGVYDWLLCDTFEPKNPHHVTVKQGIEVGNGLPNLRSSGELKKALIEAGFEVLEVVDRTPYPTPKGEIPWYLPLAGDYSWENIRSTYMGRAATTALTWTLETLRIAPKGTYATQCMLTATADDLVKGGASGIFTPAYFFLARKPF